MTTRRDLGVDAVRGVALVSMYLAHCAPTAGPGGVLLVTQYATYPLFALLVGVGVGLGARTRPGAASRTWWVGPLVRGAVLVAMAQVLEPLHAQVYVVLAYLGVLTWLTAPLARARPVVVAGVGLAALVLAPVLNAHADTWTPRDFPGGLTTERLLRFLVVGGPDVGRPYQIASMVFFAAVGILLAGRLRSPGSGGAGRQLATALVCGVAAVTLLGLERVGVLEMHAYDISYQVLVLDALLVVAIALAVVLVAHRWRALAEPLAAAGVMSLTLYSLQVAWLAYDVRVLHPLGNDNSWLNVALLTIGSVVLALAWRAVVRVEPWRRGPLEAPVALLVRSLTRERVRA